MLDISSGEYIKVLFSDDLLSPYCVEKMVSMFSDQVGLYFQKQEYWMILKKESLDMI